MPTLSTIARTYHNLPALSTFTNLHALTCVMHKDADTNVHNPRPTRPHLHTVQDACTCAQIVCCARVCVCLSVCMCVCVRVYVCVCVCDLTCVLPLPPGQHCLYVQHAQAVGCTHTF